MDINTIGIDLGKTACDVVAMDGGGKVVARRRLTRPQLVRWLANRPPCRIGMEASCGAHHLARRLAAQGHEVRLMPAQYVRPFVKTNKHDRADAEAIGAAVQRPQMRFVPIKSEAQLDLQALRAAPGRPRWSALGARRASIRSAPSCSSAASRCGRAAARLPKRCPSCSRPTS